MKKNREVEAWFEKKKLPLEKQLRRVREILLSADSRLTESVKYETLTFAYEGDFAAFVQLKGKQVTLMFNRGAKIPGKFPHLEGTGFTARFMRFSDAKKVEALAGELGRIAVAWCDWMDSGSPSP